MTTRSEGRMMNVDTGGSSAGQSAVCGASDASDQPAEIGGRRFESDPPVSAQPPSSGRDRTGCVAPDCTYSAADGSAYCTLHGLKWGRGEHVHGWDALRSVPPSWRCAYCGEITEVRP